MPGAIQPDLVRRLKSVADPAISPDGSRVAYTLSQVDPESWESSSRIMLLDLETGDAGELTAGGKDSGPRFCPGRQYRRVFADGR